MNSFPSSIKQFFSNVNVHVIHLGILITADSDSAALEVKPGMLRFEDALRVPGNADTAGLGTRFSVTRL